MSLRKYFMNLSQQYYEEIDDGVVRVTSKDGKTGVFHYDGRWIEGDVRDANVHMLMYTGGPNLPATFNYRWGRLPADPQRASGWPEPHERYLKAKGTL
jgi:hypothetical protein